MKRKFYRLDVYSGDDIIFMVGRLQTLPQAEAEARTLIHSTLIHAKNDTVYVKIVLVTNIRLGGDGVVKTIVP